MLRRDTIQYNSIQFNTTRYNSIQFNTTQFNSNTLFKDGDPVSSQLIFPGAIQTCEQYNNFPYIYEQKHRFIGQTQANTTYTFIQKHIHTYTWKTDKTSRKACIQQRFLRLSCHYFKFISTSGYFKQRHV